MIIAVQAILRQKYGYGLAWSKSMERYMQATALIASVFTWSDTDGTGN